MLRRTYNISNKNWEENNKTKAKQEKNRNDNKEKTPDKGKTERKIKMENYIFLKMKPDILSKLKLINSTEDLETMKTWTEVYICLRK